MNETRATRYQRLKRRARAAGVVSAGVTLAAVALSPAARWLADRAAGFAYGLSGAAFSLVSLGAFVLALLVLWDLATLPAMIYRARRVGGRYGGSTFSVEDVLAAQLKSTLVALPAALVAGAAVLVAYRLAGRAWWVVAALLLTAALFAALRGMPAVLVRLADVQPLGGRGLVDRIAAIAARARVPVKDILEWRVEDTSTMTALVSGVGPSRRVFVSSAVVRDWRDDEIAVVVAHELAHHAHHDLLRTLALDAGVLALSLGIAHVALAAAGPALGVAGPGDLAALPFIALVAGAVWLTATPLRHAQSRQQERRADVFALSVTGQADAFSAAIRRLGERHLAEERPSALTRWFYHRHPSVSERLALAEAFQRVRGGG
jgi:STE24 endopeptidase